MRLFKTRSRQENRQAPRYEIFQATYYITNRPQQPAVPQEGLVHNISENGMLLETAEELEPGERLTISIQLHRELLKEQCTVVRKERLITLRYGCSFDRPDTDGRRQEFIRRHLQ